MNKKRLFNCSLSDIRSLLNVKGYGKYNLFVNRSNDIEVSITGNNIYLSPIYDRDSMIRQDVIGGRYVAYERNNEIYPSISDEETNHTKDEKKQKGNANKVYAPQVINLKDSFVFVLPSSKKKAKGIMKYIMSQVDQWKKDKDSSF